MQDSRSKFSKHSITVILAVCTLTIATLVVTLFPVLIALAAPPTTSHAAATATSPVEQNPLEALVNTERTKAGKKQLSTSASLRASACAKANHMLTEGYWAHTSPSGVSPWTFFEKAGYSYTKAGENLAKSFADDASLVQAWMNSPTHRDNVLGEFAEQGVCEKGDLVVQHLGTSGVSPVNGASLF